MVVDWVVVAILTAHRGVDKSREMEPREKVCDEGADHVDWGVADCAGCAVAEPVAENSLVESGART